MPIRKKSNIFKGKALYQPDGKAAEYGRWAINFYVGCSNDCDYCYVKPHTTEVACFLCRS